ncbi:glycosyltransferase family protein [Citrobacter amalonaticus]|nr:glycosyltransferase [Citrobacter amalonaticus]MBC6532339.1 glycosyltransferase family 4 protein [Citrobacter amalonaticus]MBJ9325552.1 glycosyltransferase [Citrobacter amalonaticus]MBY5256709.1 glycosyltransferase family 4 protein [Citrobacter amalonaticus]MDT7095254.1 glycosyltransferase [Citrobacter amalonaticus]RSC60266.1 glycosyltransferase [Citrobacter amalonaticus]
MFFYEPHNNMIIINFIYPEHENLPEINHYIAYFSMCNIVCFRNATSLPKTIENVVTYVEWHIMGTHFYNKPRFLNQVSGKNYLIHEYASLSTGEYKFIKLIKDIIKRYCSHRPDYQLFLNKYIQSKMSLSGIPGELRDMGVSQEFIQSRNQTLDEKVKIYDFAYVGSMAAERKIENFLDSNVMRQKKILLIGMPPEYLVKRYKECDNIEFIGRVEQNEIPKLLTKAKVCVNYVPDVYPYNRQTSTKLIEYFTLGKDVISNRYKWVMHFVHDNSLEYESIDNEFIYIRNNGNYIASEWSSIIDRLTITRKLKNNEPL